jgi:hypothetical protein
LFSFGFAAEAHEKTLTNNAAYLVKLYLGSDLFEKDADIDHEPLSSPSAVATT